MVRSLRCRVGPSGWGLSCVAVGCGVTRVGHGWRRPVGSWGSRSQAARLSWQPMKASEQLSAHHWLVQHQNLQSICLSGMAQSRAVARLGRGLGAQGNRSSRSASRGDFPRLLPPTQRLPPCSGDGSGPSRQVLIAAQLSLRLGCSSLGSSNQGRTQERQRLIIGGPSPLPPNFLCELLDGSNPSQSRGLWEYGRENKMLSRDKLH